jgi:hypothetical protein
MDAAKDGTGIAQANDKAVATAAGLRMRMKYPPRSPAPEAPYAKDNER